MPAAAKPPAKLEILRLRYAPTQTSHRYAALRMTCVIVLVYARRALCRGDFNRAGRRDDAMKDNCECVSNPVPRWGILSYLLDGDFVGARAWRNKTNLTASHPERSGARGRVCGRGTQSKDLQYQVLLLRFHRSRNRPALKCQTKVVLRRHRNKSALSPPPFSRKFWR